MVVKGGIFIQAISLTLKEKMVVKYTFGIVWKNKHTECVTDVESTKETLLKQALFFEAAGAVAKIGSKESFTNLSLSKSLIRSTL